MESSVQKKTSVQRVMETGSGLKKTMKTRDAIMVGVGGTIGTGLFLSSGDVLSGAGPGGAILAYIIGGFIIWLMTSCLGEMCTAMPISGSVQAYATEFINPAMGFTIGWVNWLGGAITITCQIVASAIIMKNIIPSSPTILWVIVFSILLTGVNFFNVKQYGNVSFWLASLKLVLAAVFIIVGIAMILGLGSTSSVGFSNYTNNGGLFPLGLAGVGAVMLSAFYAFGGTEMIAATAGEIEREEDIPKAVNWTIFLLIGVYILCMCVLIALLPWNKADLNGSPFAYAFQHAGLHGAALVVNIIVLTSALTSGNYFVYACSRYLWSLSKFKQAPRFCSKTNKNGVPVYALGISMAFALLGVISQFVAEDTVYLFLIYLIGGCNIFMYSVICICQYKFRKRYTAEGGRVEDLKYKVPAYPLIPILGVASFIGMLIITLMDPGEAIAIYICAPCYLAIYVGFKIYTKKKNVKSINIDM